MFRNPTNRLKPVKTAPVGSPIKDEFMLITEPDGNTRLEKVGEINTEELIQSFKGETDIHNIVNRALNGDPAALQVREGAYVDLTALPQSIHDAYRLLRNAEAVYSSLSPEVRMNYGNFENFLEKVAADGKIVDNNKFTEVTKNATEQPSTIQQSTGES